MTNTSDADRVRDAFRAWEQGDSKPFFTLVADDVSWTVIGTTAVSGTHPSKAAFAAAALKPLSKRFAGPILAKTVDVRQAGDKVYLQWEGTSQGRNGRPYHQTYCWVLQFADGEIRNVVAYLDTEMVTAMFAD